MRPISNLPDHLASKRTLGYFENEKDASHQGLVSGRILSCLSRFPSTFGLFLLSLDIQSVVSLGLSSTIKSVSLYEAACLPSSIPFPSPYANSGGYSHDNRQPRSLTVTFSKGYENVSTHTPASPSFLLFLSSEPYFLFVFFCSSSFRVAVVDHAVEIRRSMLMGI